MNEPLDLTSELAHKERIEQLRLMAKSDKKYAFPIARYEVKDIITELNLRFTQYKSQSAYSADFGILQSVMDWQNVINPLQTFKPKWNIRDRISKAKVDYSLPVAMHNGKMIYVKTGGEFETFTTEKPK